MGGPNVPQRNLGSELGQVGSGFKSSILPLFNSYFSGQPLLDLSRTLASGALQGATPYLLDIIRRQGGETPEQRYQSQQATRDVFAAQGNVHGNQAAVAEVMNRDAARQARLNQAIAQEQGLITPALGTQHEATSGFASLFDPLLNYASDVFSSNQNAAAAQSIMGSNKIGGAAGGALSAIGSIAPLIAMSDERLKENVRDTGKRTPEGIPIKTFEFRDGTKRRYRGVMAQDVEKVRPDAVVRAPVTGHKMVAFNALIGAPFEEVAA